MSTMTFLGRTTREAMALAKARFGSDVEILESRQTAEGVELTAIVHGVSLQRRHLQPQVAPGYRSPAEGLRTSPEARAAASSRPAASASSVPLNPASSPAAGSASAGSMSTVSFEAYVRERQEQRPARAATTDAAGATTTASAAGAQRAVLSRPGADARAGGRGPASLTMPTSARADAAARASGSKPAGGEVNRPGSALAAAPEVMAELQSIKQFIAGQLETVRWFDTARRRPAQMRLLRRLLAGQFSPALARSLCDLLPVDFSDAEADRWLVQTLARSMVSFGGRQDGGAPVRSDVTCFDEGGIFALTGPTGVGKTTSVAKIAARHAMRHGAASVALITADVYRIGAQEQLRAFGKMLGVAVHVAHDQAALADLLGLFGDRKLVLIDTAGVGQRDERVGQLLDALSLEAIRRVVVIGAGMQSAALQDVADAWQAADAAGVLLSKTDEAVQLGGAIDCLIRNRLTLLGTTDGQRVPEDFHAPDLVSLAAASLPATDSQPREDRLADGELRFILEAAGV